MIKIAVFDVDGTLVNEAHEIAESTKIAIQALHDKGIKVVVASGRPPFLVKLGLQELPDFDYHVCSNGTFVEDKERMELYRNGLSREHVEALVSDFEAKEDAILFQFDDAAYVYHGYPLMEAMIMRWIKELTYIRDDTAKRTRHESNLPFAAVSYIAPDHLAGYKEKYPFFEFESFTQNHYDIYKKNSSKADGVRILCESLGVKMEEVIAFGDNFNDYKMIEQVGIGVAMENAIPELKEVSDFVTLNIDDGGIYHACKHFNLI